MAVSRSAASQPRAWFPPATFQMRLRGLRSIIYLASSLPRKENNSNGYFYITIHENSSDPMIIWKSDLLEWSADRQERLTWTDIDLGGGSGLATVSDSKTALKLGRESAIIRVWFVPSIKKDQMQNHSNINKTHEENAILETSWEVHFSGLICLGVNPPAHGRLPPDFLVFYISGSYFTSPFESAVSKGNYIPRYLHIFDSNDKKQKESCIKSYDTGLLLRLHRIQRALIKQETANSRIKQELKHLGILDSSELKKNGGLDDRRSPQLTLRECVFATKRVKTSSTRIAESSLKYQLESLQMRCKLLAKEKQETKEKLKETEHKSNVLKEELNTKNSIMMNNIRDLSRERTNFYRWFETFNLHVQSNRNWSNALKEQRLHVIRSFNDVFPIDLANNIATMRSISLPSVDKFKDYSNRYEDISVVMGWVVNLLHTFSFVFDTPLRYQFKVLGSTSSIIDHIKVLDEKTVFSREFPLYLKSAKCNRTEWDRFLYGVSLLNKNLVQLRYELGKNTSDPRPILQNVADIMALGRDSFTIQGIVNALPKTISLTLPPRSNSSLCSLSVGSINSALMPTVSKNVISVEEISSQERGDEACIKIEDGVNSRGDLQSHILRGDSQNQRQYNNDSDLNKVESTLSHDKQKSEADDVNDLVAGIQNTRPYSASSSSSYDTIETDRVSDDNMESITNQSNVKNKSSSHNLSKFVRNVEERKNEEYSRQESHTDDIDINAPKEGGYVKSPKRVVNPFEQPLPDQDNKGNHSVTNNRDQLNEENLNSLFWGDVTSRTSALSKPSSFQRPRTNH